MRAVELVMRAMSHLNIGGLIAVVLWVIWIAAMTASPGWADPSPSLIILKPCPCMQPGAESAHQART